jgi:membrane protein DedA with SNARE-associated domain
MITSAPAMTGAEYVVLSVCVTIMGFGIPGPGDASLLAAGTPAGEGRLNVGIVLVVSAVAWMAGSVIGYAVGHHGGRRLLDSPGWLENAAGTCWPRATGPSAVTPSSRP